MKQASARPKGKRASAVRPRPAVAPAAELSGGKDAWWWTGAAILLISSLLRLILLTQKPLHHDEGVNGVFLTTLFRTGFYHYDPANYHGPTLYYLALVPAAINNLFHWGHGLSTFGVRLVTAVFGVGVVWLLLCLRRELGSFGSIAAALLASVSAGFVFFSRYFIHEILFVFFTLGMVVALLYYRRTQRPLYFYLASASAGMLGATKETWIITFGVWLIALPCTSIYLRMHGVPGSGERFVPARDRREIYLRAALLFLGIWVVFYSSFFTNPKGLLDSVRTFAYWTKTSDNGIYNQPWTTYANWLWQEESPILLLGILGTGIALWKARDGFSVFCAFWTIGIFAAYSLVPYKTPWLALSIILPLTMMAGMGLEAIWQTKLAPAAPLAALAAGAFCFYQAFDLSFYHYDDDTYAYIYAHTRRDFLKLVEEINSIAARDPAGKTIGITVMANEHWPLPWYLREYTRVGYWGKVVPTDEPLVIALEPQVPQVTRQLGDKYHLVSSHDLRPGNRLFLFERNKLKH